MKFIIPYFLVALLSGSTYWFFNQNKGLLIGIDQLKKDNKELSEQVKKVQFEKQHQLQVSDSAYAAINTIWKLRNDSAMRANGIQQKDILELTDLVEQYRDSITHMAIMGQSVLQPEQIINGKKDTIPEYKTPFTNVGKCITVSGVVQSTYPNPKVEITDQRFDYTVREVVVRQKRALGFLWITQREQRKILSDCGTVTVTDIQFLNHLP